MRDVISRLRDSGESALADDSSRTLGEYPKEVDFGPPPEDIHIKCGSCFRRGIERKADCFSFTPSGQKHFLERKGLYLKDGALDVHHTLKVGL